MRRNLVDANHEQPPANGPCEQCTRRLVDVKGVFQSDEQVAQNENGENNKFHGVCEFGWLKLQHGGPSRV